jgi:ribose transport system permease protein
MLLKAGVPVPLAIVITLFAASLVGVLNGTLTNAFKVHPFIITMATLLTLRGVDLVITGGTSISGLPDTFTFLGQDRFLGIRISLLVFLVLALIVGYALRNHQYMQQAYFIGGNRRAARMSGVKVERFLLFAFILNAFLAGIAGILVCAQYGAASVSYGQNAELRVIAATAIGGTSFSGGSGTIPGTVLGVIFLAMIYNAFNMTGINTYWQDVAIGVMLLAAVFLGEVLKRRRISR